MELLLLALLALFLICVIGWVFLGVLYLFVVTISEAWNDGKK